MKEDDSHEGRKGLQFLYSELVKGGMRRPERAPADSVPFQFFSFFFFFLFFSFFFFLFFFFFSCRCPNFSKQMVGLNGNKQNRTHREMVFGYALRSALRSALAKYAYDDVDVGVTTTWTGELTLTVCNHMICR